MTFEMTFPETIEEAVELSKDGARWFAGGTDLIPEYKTGLARPSRLINLKRIPALRGITIRGDGVRIGALTTLDEIAYNTTLRAEYPALARACELSASPQVRNVATLAGNLCQDSRCPYYRGEFHCYLKGGDTCFMRDGDNPGAAVTGYRDCVHTNPSDPATALVALDAEIVTRSKSLERIIPVGSFFKAPQGDDRRMNVLEPGQMISEIKLPRQHEGSRSVFLKAMDRAAWAFALTSVAIRVDMDGERIADSRVVLGGVAPVPWREPSVEEHIRGGTLGQELAAKAGAAALREASPLMHNRYKLKLGRAMIKRALDALLLSSKDGS